MDVAPAPAGLCLLAGAGCGLDSGLRRNDIGGGAGFIATSAAQAPGWSYSPLPGEGDRAALGCSRESRPGQYACLAVRCEDDFAIGVHIHTSRPEGDAGEWSLVLDREFALQLRAEPSEAPYGARVSGEVADLVEGLKQSGLAYLDAADGDVSAQIPLTGSLAAINAALFFCAPRVKPPSSGDEVAPVDGQDGAGDVAGEGRAEE